MTKIGENYVIRFSVITHTPQHPPHPIQNTHTDDVKSRHEKSIHSFMLNDKQKNRTERQTLSKPNVFADNIISYLVH